MRTIFFSGLFFLFLAVSGQQAAVGDDNIGGRFGVGPRYISFSQSDSLLSLKDTIGGNMFFTIPIKKELGPISMIGVENAMTFYKTDSESLDGYTRNFSIGQKLVLEKQFFKSDLSDYRMAFHVGAGYMYHTIRDFRAEDELEQIADSVDAYIDMENSWGMVGSAGIDYYPWSIGLLRLNFEYTTGASDVYIRNPSVSVKAGEVDLSNMSVTLSMGFRF